MPPFDSLVPVPSLQLTITCSSVQGYFSFLQLKPDPANRSKVIRVLQDMFEVVTQDMLSDEARCVALSASNSRPEARQIAIHTHSAWVAALIGSVSRIESSAVPELFMLQP